MFEIEKKARIESTAGLFEILQKNPDFQYLGSFHKQDLYFAENVVEHYEDFSSLRNLFRVRYQQEEVFLTVKKKSFSGNTEVNREHEVLVKRGNEEKLRAFWRDGLTQQATCPLQEMLNLKTPNDWKDFWKRHGFSFLLNKEKMTKLFTTQMEGYSISLELNEIVDLGFFIEVEILTEHSQKIEKAISLIDTIFENLGLNSSQEEPKLYIQLLYEKFHPPGPRMGV